MSFQGTGTYFSRLDGLDFNTDLARLKWVPVPGPDFWLFIYTGYSHSIFPLIIIHTSRSTREKIVWQSPHIMELYLLQILRIPDRIIDKNEIRTATIPGTH